MKIALAQINPTVGDFAGNTAKILDYSGAAGSQGASLVLFPELSLCGYPPADLLEKHSFLEQANQALARVAEATSATGHPAILLGTAMPVEHPTGKKVRNVAVLLADGKVQFLQQKMLLPYYDVFDEQRYFEPAIAQGLVEIDGQTVAITICEDAWNDKNYWPRPLYAVDPVEELMRSWPAEQNDSTSPPRIILNISASPYWTGKRQLRQQMLGALAVRHNAYVAMVNQVGGNDSLVFDGSSIAIAPDGRMIARAASFEEDLIFFETDGQLAAALPSEEGDWSDDTAASWDALVLGTRDYVRKCGFQRAIVGLSGGIDSAVVAAIAVEALGAENVRGVGMPSQYSSSGSIEDARELAANLSIAFDLLPIEPVFARYQATLEPLFRGTPVGIAEENLQSRIRGALLMALSNKFGALVLTTGNKSEMATGYCTLYGDMVGGLAVIGDVFKTRVYELSRYANRSRTVIPIATIEKPPSAELRPDQLDVDSLPPYEVLDPILEAYVEHYRSAEEIASSQQRDLALVQSVLQLVERSEYKRQQAAPVLKITGKSFGMGRRFPIAAKVKV